MLEFRQAGGQLAAKVVRGEVQAGDGGTRDIPVDEVTHDAVPFTDWL
jgi:hypothetical protein